MALLVVLFLVMAVVSVSLGILYRADLAAASGHSYTLRTQADYIAWAGLEHARTAIIANPNLAETAFSKAPFTLDEDALFYYLLTIDPNTASIDPNSAPWRYAVECEVYYDKDQTQSARSKLAATILYDPNTLSTGAWLTRIRRHSY